MDVRRNASVAVIGAGDFIGAAIARRFAAGGYAVFAGRRNGEKLAPLVAEIEAAGGRCNGRTLDAREEPRSPASWPRPTTAPLEVCIFNVGANVQLSDLETTERVFRKVWEMACYARLPGGAGGGAADAAARPRHDHLHRRHRQPARRLRLRRLRQREVRPARRWRRAWRASSGRRTSMSRIWSSMPASTPPGCASASARAPRPRT